MSLINWIFDAYQHHKLDQNREETRRLRDEVASMRMPSGGVNEAELERAIGELALAIKSVQRIVVEKGLCTETEFRAKMRDVDAEDGRIDGTTFL